MRWIATLLLAGCATPPARDATLSDPPARIEKPPPSAGSVAGASGAAPEAAPDSLGVLGDPQGDAIVAVAVSPDGESVATVSGDRLLLWPNGLGTPRVLRGGDARTLTAVAFSLDGKHVAIGTAGDRFADPEVTSFVEVWDVVRGKRRFAVKRSKTSVTVLGFSRAGLQVLDRGTEMATLDARTGALRAKRTLAPDEWGQDVELIDAEFSPDATALVASFGGGKEYRFVVQDMMGKDLSSGSAHAEYEQPRASGFGRDGRAWRCDKPCMPHDTRTGAPVAPDPGAVVEYYFTPNDPAAFAVPRWRGNTIEMVMGCHAFHPDGKRFLACSPDGRVRIWSLAELKRL